MPGVDSYQGALLALDAVLLWLRSGSPAATWIPYNIAAKMLGMTWGEVCRRAKKVDTEKPIFNPVVHPEGLNSSNNCKYIHIVEVWEQAQWIWAYDVRKRLKGEKNAILQWRDAGLIHPVYTPFRGSKFPCIHIVEALNLEYLIKVRELVGWKYMGWDEVQMWATLGPEVVTEEAARKAIEEIQGKDHE